MNNSSQAVANQALTTLATRVSMTSSELQSVILNTLMPSKIQPTIEQFNAFVAVANEYKLNPITKEIYAFPAKSGGIQPVVSIDGWLRVINSHPDFNGMTFSDERSEDGKIISITCRIHKKGIQHPVEVTEYMAECAMGTEPWRKFPSRMLRHKAAIQAGRYAFGLSGIIDPDEADRYASAKVINPEHVAESTVHASQPEAATHVEQEPEQEPVEGEYAEYAEPEAEAPSEEPPAAAKPVADSKYLPASVFDSRKDQWIADINKGNATVVEIVEFLLTKGFVMTDEQFSQLPA